MQGGLGEIMGVIEKKVVFKEVKESSEYSKTCMSVCAAWESVTVRKFLEGTKEY